MHQTKKDLKVLKNEKQKYKQNVIKLYGKINKQNRKFFSFAHQQIRFVTQPSSIQGNPLNDSIVAGQRFVTDDAGDGELRGQSPDQGMQYGDDAVEKPNLPIEKQPDSHLI